MISVVTEDDLSAHVEQQPVTECCKRFSRLLRLQRIEGLQQQCILLKLLASVRNN
jgi:hypothetical protein